MKRLEPNVLHRAKQMLHRGMSTREVSRQLKISQASVVNIRKAEDLTRIKVKSGRPRIVTERDARRIGRAVATGKARTPKEAAQIHGVQGSVATVRRALKKIGYTVIRSSKQREQNKTEQKHKTPKS